MQVVSPSPAEAAVLYQPQPAQREGGRVVIGDWESPSNFAPLFNAEQPAAQLDALLYSGLVRQTADLQWIPDLVTRVPSLANGDVRWDRPATTMTVTYHLRPGLLWSDGTPLTAADVAYTWRTIVDPRVQGVLSTEGYANISRVEVQNDLTIVLHFDRLYPQYLQLFPAILPEHRLRDIAVDRLNADGFWSRPDVVGGPYKISELVPDEHITLVPNAQWSAGRNGRRPHLDQIVYKIYPELGRLLDAARAGQVDLAMEIPDDALATLPAQGKLALRSRSSLAYEQVTFNQVDPDPLTGQPPLWKGDPVLLAALRAAVDRQAMVQGLLGGKARVADSPIPSALSGYHQAVSPVYDLARANQLLDQDGWVRGADGIRLKNGRRLSFSLTIAVGDPLRLSLRDGLVAAWRKIGADVVARDGHSSELFSGFDQGGWLEHGQFEAGLWTWSIGPDPDGVYAIDHSSQIPTAQNQGRGANFGRFQSAAIDQSLDQGRATLRIQDRVRAYRAFEQAYAQLGAELPLYERMLSALVSPRIHNVQLNPSPATTLWNAIDWWVD
jgi:peptide/nickel transport system substrate-binding protein